MEEKTAKLAISLPQGARVKVKEGEKVKKGQLLAQLQKGEGVELDLARPLGVAGPKVVHHILVVAGDQVEVGQIIAARKKFRLFKRTFKSPLAGKVAKLTEEGKLEVLVGGDGEAIVAPAEGKIIQAGKDRITLEFMAQELTGQSGIGGQGAGPIAIVGKREEPVLYSDLGRDLEGKIAVVGGQVTLDIWQKAQALGVAGLVCGSMSRQVEKTHNPQVPLLVVGADDGLISAANWKILSSFSGRDGIVEGEGKRLLIVED